MSADEPTAAEIAAAFPALTAKLEPPDLERFAAALVPQRLMPGEVLLHEGTAYEALHLLLRGQLKVTLRSRGAATDLGRLDPGAVLGEVSVLDGGPASATVSAVDDAVVLSLSRGRLATMHDKHPDTAATLYRSLCAMLAERLRGTTLRFECLSRGTPTQHLPRPEHSRVLDLFRSLLGLGFGDP